jgi:hypothetical protein
VFESVLGWLKHAGIMVFVQSLRLFLKTFAFVSQRERERERERGSSGSWLCDFALKYSWIAIERERESEGDLGGLLLALCWWMVYFALCIGIVHDNSTLI